MLLRQRDNDGTNSSIYVNYGPDVDWNIQNVKKRFFLIFQKVKRTKKKNLDDLLLHDKEHDKFELVKIDKDIGMFLIL